MLSLSLSFSVSFSPKALKRKAVDIILRPLQCVSAQSQDTGITDSQNCALYIMKTMQFTYGSLHISSREDEFSPKGTAIPESLMCFPPHAEFIKSSRAGIQRK